MMMICRYLLGLRFLMREGVKQRWGSKQQQFSVFLVVILSKTLEIRPTLLHSDMLSLVGFLLTPKRITLNDPEWVFLVKFCPTAVFELARPWLSKTVA